MLQRPQFKAHLRVESLPAQGLFLLSERRQTVLRGRLYELVAPLIDGVRSADAIAELLDGKLCPADVYYTLGQLEKQGWLAESNGRESASARAFWHVQDIDPTVAVRRLAQTTVAITTFGGIDSEPLATALRALQVDVAGEGQLGVVVSDDYLRSGLESFNKAALDSGQSWMLIKPVGSHIWLGPLFRPGQTACWQCLAERLRGNREAEVYVHKMAGRDDPFPVPFADTPATRTIAWNVAATEISKWITRGGTSDLEGRILTLDVLSWKTQWHTVVRRPQCPACGHPLPLRFPVRGAGGARPIVLESRKKVLSHDGGHRAISPEETLCHYEHHVSRLTGAVTILERFHSSGDGVVHVYGAGQNFARRQGSIAAIRKGLRSQSSGKGTSDVQARASGLCEALERYCGYFRGDEPRTVPCRFDQLGEAAIHPNACMQYSERQYRERDAWNVRQSAWNGVPRPFNEEEAVEWTPVWSLTRRDVRYLPTAFCYYDYPAEPPFCFACSNGNAAGNTLEEAILQGFFELVERDSVALWWYNRLRRPAVDFDSFDEPYLRRLTSYLAQRHRDLWALDLTADLEIPAFAALSRRTDRLPEEILFGFGAHFDARVALLRAVTELNQMLSWVPTDGCSKPITTDSLDDPETLAWLQTATLANLPYLVPDGGARARRRRDYPVAQTEDLRDDVLACQALVERQGLEMLVLDQTRPDIGLPVVKVIVPGLRHFWARYAPGRLFDVPVRLGWLPQPLREADLNPIPMFL